MGASFRTAEQVLELAGCDLLTVSPGILEQLSKSTVSVPRKLDPLKAASSQDPKLSYNEKSFLQELEKDEMASFKLTEGIRNFAADTVKLEDEIRPKLATQKAKL